MSRYFGIVNVPGDGPRNLALYPKEMSRLEFRQLPKGHVFVYDNDYYRKLDEAFGEHVETGIVYYMNQDSLVSVTVDKVVFS